MSLGEFEHQLELLIIDPQNDFHPYPNSTLGVNGALEDAKRIANLIHDLKDSLDDIRVTVDTHQKMAIFFARMWHWTSKRRSPDFFQVISEDDVKNGTFRAAFPVMQPIFEDYVRKLAENGRYQLTIWPDHCLFGTWGYNIQDDIMASLMEWEEKYAARVGFEQKGHSMFTEHYSAVQADVQSDDPTTQMNTRLVDSLKRSRQVIICGQAADYCVANTGIDIANYFGPDAVKQLVFLSDCMSSVNPASGVGQAFLDDMKNRGATVCTAREFLSK